MNCGISVGHPQLWRHENHGLEPWRIVGHRDFFTGNACEKEIWDIDIGCTLDVIFDFFLELQARLLGISDSLSGVPKDLAGKGKWPRSGVYPFPLCRWVLPHRCSGGMLRCFDWADIIVLPFERSCVFCTQFTLTCWTPFLTSARYTFYLPSGYIPYTSSAELGCNCLVSRCLWHRKTHALECFAVLMLQICDMIQHTVIERHKSASSHLSSLFDTCVCVLCSFAWTYQKKY